MFFTAQMLFLLEAWGCSRHFSNVPWNRPSCSHLLQSYSLPVPPEQFTSSFIGYLVTSALTETHQHSCAHLVSSLFPSFFHKHTGTHNRQPNYTQKLLRAFSRGYLHVYLFVFYQIFDLCLRLTGSAPWQVPGKAFGST